MPPKSKKKGSKETKPAEPEYDFSEESTGIPELNVNEDDDVQENSQKKQNPVDLDLKESITNLSLSEQPIKKVSKSQKRKVAKANAEKEREERIREEQMNVVNYRDLENASLMKKLTPLGLRIKEIAPDGNCLYSAIADQLELHGQKIAKDYFKVLRHLAADFMRNHPDEFMPFLDFDDSVVSEDNFKNYCNTVANTTTWGGQLELKALVHSLKTPITIYTAGEREPNIEMGQEYSTEQPLCLSYHRHAYSLGEHYNSIVPLS